MEHLTEEDWKELRILELEGNVSAIGAQLDRLERMVKTLIQQRESEETA